MPETVAGPKSSSGPAQHEVSRVNGLPSAEEHQHRIKVARQPGWWDRFVARVNRGIDTATVHAPDTIDRQLSRFAARNTGQGGGLAELLPAGKKFTESRIQRRREAELRRMVNHGGRITVMGSDGSRNPFNGDAETLSPEQRAVNSRTQEVITDIAIGAYHSALSHTEDRTDLGPVDKTRHLTEDIRPEVVAKDNGNGTWTVTVIRNNSSRERGSYNPQTGEFDFFPTAKASEHPQVARASVATYIYRPGRAENGVFVERSDSLRPLAEQKDTDSATDLLVQADAIRTRSGIVTEKGMHEDVSRIITSRLDGDSTDIVAVHVVGHTYPGGEKVFVRAMGGGSMQDGQSVDSAFFTEKDDILAGQVLQEASAIDLRGTRRVVVLKGREGSRNAEGRVYGERALTEGAVKINGGEITYRNEETEKEGKAERRVVTLQMSEATHAMYQSLPTDYARAAFRREYLGERLGESDSEQVRIRIEEVQWFPANSEAGNDDFLLSGVLTTQLVHYGDWENEILTAREEGREPHLPLEDQALRDPAVVLLMLRPEEKNLTEASHTVGQVESDIQAEIERQITLPENQRRSEFAIALDIYQKLLGSEASRKPIVEDAIVAMHPRNAWETIVYLESKIDINRDQHETVAQFRDRLVSILSRVPGADVNSPLFKEQIARVLVRKVGSAAEAAALRDLYTSRDQTFESQFPSLARELAERQLSNDPLQMRFEANDTESTVRTRAQRMVEGLPISDESKKALVKLTIEKFKAPQLPARAMVELAFTKKTDPVAFEASAARLEKEAINAGDTETVQYIQQQRENFRLVRDALSQQDELQRLKAADAQRAQRDGESVAALHAAALGMLSRASQPNP